MLIDAVTVCSGYADFLAETLPVNLPHFNRLVVVTSPDDRETIDLCRRYSVECRPTRLLQSNGRRFAKARGIQYGLSFLSSSNWILHFDTDIAFPPDMRRLLMTHDLDPKAIYGADRVNCYSFAEWRDHLASHRFQFAEGYRSDPPPFPLGSRLILPEFEGYVPIGFFQLWHASTGRRYPITERDGGEHTDVLHAIQWDRVDRHLLPEFVVVHLDSGRHPWGINWHGRKTERFAAAKSKAQSQSGYSY